MVRQEELSRAVSSQVDLSFFLAHHSVELIDIGTDHINSFRCCGSRSKGLCSIINGNSCIAVHDPIPQAGSGVLGCSVHIGQTYDGDGCAFLSVSTGIDILDHRMIRQEELAGTVGVQVDLGSFFTHHALEGVGIGSHFHSWSFRSFGHFGCLHRRFGSFGFTCTAAGYQGQQHNNCQNQGQKLFHLCFLLN